MNLVLTESGTWGGMVTFRPEDMDEQVAECASVLDPVEYAEYEQDPDEVDLPAILRAATRVVDTETADADDVRDLRSAAQLAPVDDEIEAAIVAAERRIAQEPE